MSEPTNIPVQRNTDFVKIDSLNYLATEHGLVVKSFYQTLQGQWCVEYFDRSLWIEPQRAFLPTDFIYEKQMADYIRRCTLTSKPYPRFEDMVMGEIKRLKEQLP